MIVCFSGNGNSRYAAQLLAKELGDEIFYLAGEAARNPAAAICSTGGGKPHRVVWICPVHSWGLPKPVVRAMKEMQPEGAAEARHHLVLTMGDDAGLAHKMWRKLMARRGWNAVSAFTVVMPNTYVSFPGFDVDSPELAARKLAAVPARVREIASKIADGVSVDDVHEGSFPWVKTKLIYPSFMQAVDKSFKSHDCIACGRCVGICPMENITLEKRPDGSIAPQWHGDCALCYGCYNICPVHAIEYGRFTAGKGQYHCTAKA